MRLQLSVRSQVALSRYSSYGAQGDTAPLLLLLEYCPASLLSVFFLVFIFSLPSSSYFQCFLFVCLFCALSTVDYWKVHHQRQEVLPFITKGLS